MHFRLYRNITRLTAELKDLEAEQKRYAETWADRQTAFDAIVKSLEELGERVREEKSEQERRDALGDDDVQEETSLKQPVSNGEDAGAEQTRLSSKARILDSDTNSLEPPMLRQSGTNGTSPIAPEGDCEAIKESAYDTISKLDPPMEVDEDSGHDIREHRIEKRSRSRSRSTREEGEEEEQEKEQDREEEQDNQESMQTT